MAFQYGIEHEIAFEYADGSFADFTNTQFEDFSVLIDQMPVYETDYSQLRVGDAGIRYKRWYIEGLERFDNEGHMLYCTPKGIEIRTTIHPSPQDAVSELNSSFNMLKETCQSYGFTPLLTSYNPVSPPFQIIPPFNEYELQKFAVTSVEKLAIPMMTYGPDLNISTPGLTDAELISIAKKLVYATPFIIPFSFSSPFAEGVLWEGLSKRTVYRSGFRPVVIAYLKDKTNVTKSHPIITKEARLDAETGRIEYKAFDSCGDFSLYGSLLVLLKGLILDTTISDQLIKPDVPLIMASAKEGFTNPSIYEGARLLLASARAALDTREDRRWLDPLEELLTRKASPASYIIQQAQSGADMFAVMKSHYTWTIASECSAKPSFS